MPATRRALIATAATLPLVAHAQARPALVELFTSQSCSSCPPADALLGELARRPGVIALSFHVDYWDRLGWKDPFSSPAWTARQRDYGRQFNLRAIYTPQIVVDGALEMVGSDRRAVDRALASARPAGVAVAVTRDAEGLLLRVGAGEGAARVMLAAYVPGATTRVLGGENSGRTLTHTNIVRRLDAAGSWTGAEASWRVPAEAGLGYALFVQDADGRVLGAAAVG